MAKFKVRCYYTYVGCVEVEAKNEEEAYVKGCDLCNGMSTEDLTYVGYTDCEVTNESGVIFEYS